MIFIYIILAWLLIGFLTAYVAHKFLDESSQDATWGDVAHISLLGLIAPAVLLIDYLQSIKWEPAFKVAFKGKRK